MRGDNMAVPDPDSASQILQNPFVQWGARWIGEIIFGLCLALLAILKFIGKRALADIDNLKKIDTISRGELDDCKRDISESINSRFNAIEDLIRKEVRAVHKRVDATLQGNSNNKKEEG